MKLSIWKLLTVGLVAALMVGCGGSNGGPSKTSKTIKGVAVKANGALYGEAATVLAVDSNGNTAKGKVDAQGNYSVTLTGVAASGKKGKLVEGNSYIRVYDGTSTLDLVLSEEQTHVNINAVTSAASLLAIGSSSDKLNAIFDEVEDVEGKKEKTVASSAVLATLAKVQALTEKLFKDSADSIVGALFGFDSNGKPAVSADNLLSGDAKAKELVLVKAAASLSGDLVAAAVSAANNPSHNTFLLEDSAFFEAVAKELASSSDKPSANAFSDFLNSVLKSDEAKTALKEIKDALNEYVAAVKADPHATLEVEIPEVVKSAPTVNVSVTRSGDVVTYDVTGGKDGDTTEASIAVISDSKVEAVITISLKYNSELDRLTADKASVRVTSGSISVTIKNPTSIDAETVNLATALGEAKTALINAGHITIADKIPKTANGLTLEVSALSVVRKGVNTVNTFINNKNAAGGVSLN